MKYSQIVDRIRKVVNSCETLDQLSVAGRYSKFMITRQIMIDVDDDDDDLHEYFSKLTKRDELFYWLKMIVNKRKVQIS